LDLFFKNFPLGVYRSLLSFKGVFLGCIYEVVYWLRMGRFGVKFGWIFGVWERERLPRPAGGEGEKKPKTRLRIVGVNRCIEKTNAQGQAAPFLQTS